MPDLLKVKNIVLELPKNCWYYDGSVNINYPFAVQTVLYKLSITEIELWEEEGMHLSTYDKDKLNELLSDSSDLFSPNVEQTPFAEVKKKQLGAYGIFKEWEVPNVP